MRESVSNLKMLYMVRNMKVSDFSLDDNDVILSMHAVTYKTTLLKDIALRLDEGGELY